MGEEKTYVGVRAASASSIVIDFKYKGVRCRELIALQPTPKNLQHASKLRDKVLFDIGCGNFDYAAAFPDSPMLLKLGLKSKPILLQDLLNQWLDSQLKLVEKSTYNSYVSALRHHIIPELGDLELDNVTLPVVREWRDSLIGEVSNKTINNVMTPLRQSLQLATENGWITNNPLNNLRNLGKAAPAEVDPFTFDEVKHLLETCEEGYERNLWQFAIFTGLRCGELMPLRWANVDLEQGLVHVRDNLVLGENKAPKTSLSRRTIQLIEPALEAIKGQHKFTSQGEFVWVSPRSGQPLTTHKQLTGAWKRLMSRSGLEYKNLYSCRHTFASLMLSAGEPAVWVASQMGHANLAMLQKHYGRWLTNQKVVPGNRAMAMYRLPNPEYQKPTSTDSGDGSTDSQNT